MRDRALHRNGNGVSWKWSLVKKDTCVFLTKRINGLSVKRDKSWVDLKFFRFTGASTFALMPQQAENQNPTDGTHQISFKINEKCWRNFKLSSQVII